MGLVENILVKGITGNCFMHLENFACGMQVHFNHDLNSCKVICWPDNLLQSNPLFSHLNVLLIL